MIEFSGGQFPRNLACLTCEHVLAGELVDHVFMDDEGDFQFHCDQPHDVEQAKIMALEEIVNSDAALKMLPRLSKGQHAHRNGTNWVVG